MNQTNINTGTNWGFLFGAVVAVGMCAATSYITHRVTVWQVTNDVAKGKAVIETHTFGDGHMDCRLVEVNRQPIQEIPAAVLTP